MLGFLNRTGCDDGRGEYGLIGVERGNSIGVIDMKIILMSVGLVDYMMSVLLPQQQPLNMLDGLGDAPPLLLVTHIHLVLILKFTSTIIIYIL